MEWIRVIVGTVAALLFGLFMAMFTWRSARRKKAKQPTYEEVTIQRDALLFWFSFVGFWILVAAPYVDWSCFGEPWTGLFFSVCLMAVLCMALLVYKRRGRRKLETQGPSHALRS
jgi:tetrahydromethanopterin S-methyltransferase subunit E